MTLTRPDHSTRVNPGGSFYLPPNDDSSVTEEISFDSAPATTKREPKSKTTDPLNDYLRTREISPIRSRLGVLALGKKRVKEHDATTCGRQVKVYLHFYKT